MLSLKQSEILHRRAATTSQLFSEHPSTSYFYYLNGLQHAAMCEKHTTMFGELDTTMFGELDTTMFGELDFCSEYQHGRLKAISEANLAQQPLRAARKKN